MTDSHAQHAACPCCGADETRRIWRQAHAPSNSCILLRTPEDARAYPTGEIDLQFCDACGFAFNAAFDADLAEYSGRYEETQGFSPTFSRFHRALAERLAAAHDLEGKRVVEIGCGKGEFLTLLAEVAGARGLGVDPAAAPERLGPAAAELDFAKAFFAEEHLAGDVDLVVCKMTLEHIADVAPFLTRIRRGLGARRAASVFFQVPDGLRVLREAAFEDVYYEHCSYFTPGALAHAFARTGFAVESATVEYAGQYLTLTARPAAPHAEPIADLDEARRLAADFEARMSAKIAGWRDRVAAEKARGGRVLLWGSGSKAVSFLSALGPDLAAAVDGVTDINPHRQGCFMPKTAHEILSPSALPALAPTLVIAMNPIYQDEIRADLAGLGLSPALTAL